MNRQFLLLGKKNIITMDVYDFFSVYNQLLCKLYELCKSDRSYN